MADTERIELTAAGMLALFGAASFSLPDNEVKAKNGAELKARVVVPFGGLEFETAVWMREHVYADKGYSEQVFSISLPRGIRGRKDDTEVDAALQQWKGDTLLAFDEWLSKVEAAGDAAKRAQRPRLVRKVQHAKPNENTAAVQAAAAVASAVTGSK